jgi:peptidoglycan/LPS O-acetylase OafA/YrhL
VSTPYRADIDALRGIAVAAVVVFHAFPALLPGGFVGVDVFFVISGYLITGIVARDLEAGRFSLWRFYSRRINRIVPALLAVLTACLLGGWWLLLSGEYRALGTHTAGASVFGSNFVLLSEAGYFDEAAHTKPLLHLWSLGIEEQFYIAWPLALWLTLRLGRAPAKMAWVAVVLSFTAAVWIVFVRQGGRLLPPVAACVGAPGRRASRHRSAAARRCVRSTAAGAGRPRWARCRGDARADAVDRPTRPLSRRLGAAACARRGGGHRQRTRCAGEPGAWRVARAGLGRSDQLPAVSLALAAADLRPHRCR